MCAAAEKSCNRVIQITALENNRHVTPAKALSARPSFFQGYPLKQTNDGLRHPHTPYNSSEAQKSCAASDQYEHLQAQTHRCDGTPSLGHHLLAPAA